MERKTIYVDEHGRSPITSLNGDDYPDVGSFGENLSAGDTVEVDGQEYTVEKVYSYIQTGNPGTSNFVAIDLA